MDNNVTTQYFRSLGEYTYVKLAILRKRDQASEYLEKINSLSNDCEFNKLIKKHYTTKFKAAISDLYMKIEPYLKQIKDKKNYTELEKLNPLENKKKTKIKLELKDHIKQFMLLNKAVFVLGISDLNISDGTDPAHSLG